MKRIISLCISILLFSSFGTVFAIPLPQCTTQTHVTQFPFGCALIKSERPVTITFGSGVKAACWFKFTKAHSTGPIQIHSSRDQYVMSSSTCSQTSAPIVVDSSHAMTYLMCENATLTNNAHESAPGANTVDMTCNKV